MKALLSALIANPRLHAKWLNTLSYLENCGARKIAACQHPTLVKEERLKHSAEEFRHAYHLKRQIGKISSEPFEDYSLSNLLGGYSTLHYLHRLDLGLCRLLKASKPHLIYYLTTYAIEQRASFLYPLYDEALRRAASKVSVKSILLEEEEHLDEMKRSLTPEGLPYLAPAAEIEEALFQKWKDALHSTL